MKEQRFDMWAAGDAYERYMGRWSRPVADGFVAWLSCEDGLWWLDVGCGTGALTATVAARCRPRMLVGLDRSAGFVVSARAAAPASACFVVADALSLPVGDGACDVAVSGLALNFLPAPGSAVAEAARVVRPGGLVAAYVWDYAEGMAFLRHFWDAAVTVDPSAVALDETHRFPVCRPDVLRALWMEAGLVDVAVAPIEVPTVFADFADLWEPFLAGQGPAPGYVAALAPAVRDRLRDTLSEAVPTRPDGAIALTARAWAVQGRRPVRAGEDGRFDVFLSKFSSQADRTDAEGHPA
ncbi:class I SAM-dependent methyltransferase [Streptomyces sp. ISL-98]|uniref:class I SAM-dependent methyltransferase n=1 Tax=Streptomyces sp. ISL-98 TaxID=2819192 RepID=UPI001BE8CD14|nr:class I SAM-dependent methyltransferase [Streptomyces sp. ISL-98]MBT2507780.1 class I SAM-dependent methyltransferase [Streptomyces sp. ISL-98]